MNCCCETARIQTHLDGALNMTDLFNCVPLSVSDSLLAYRNAGLFPVVRSVPRGTMLDKHGRTPCFVDDSGTPCALAHILIAHGRDQLVREIAATAVFATVAELYSMSNSNIAVSQLFVWLVEHGISVELAARIQPGYVVGRERCDKCGEEYPVHRTMGDSGVYEGCSRRCRLYYTRCATPGCVLLVENDSRTTPMYAQTICVACRPRTCFKCKREFKSETERSACPECCVIINEQANRSDGRKKPCIIQ